MSRNISDDMCDLKSGGKDNNDLFNATTRTDNYNKKQQNSTRSRKPHFHFDFNNANCKHMFT